MKHIILTILAVLLSSDSFSQTEDKGELPFCSSESPKREVRAVWLTTIGGLDWPKKYANGSASSIGKQKQEFTEILDKLQKAGVNTVLLQTRIRGTVIYPSALEPWDGCLSGTPGISPGYDALAFCVEECHKRGMEIHAWLVTIPVGKWNGKGCSTLRKKYPFLIKKIDDEGYMDPENAKTADIIAEICEEITQNYDIDGIHLDYIRYPESWKKFVSKSTGRDYITDIVRKTNRVVKALKPWVKMSCSPIGKFDDLPRQSSNGWNAHSRVYQDAQGWLKEGLMDALFPMMYFKNDNFYPFALDWKEQSNGRIIAPGLGIYFMSPTEKDWNLNVISQEMEVLRQWGMGHTYFRSRFFTDNTKGIYNFASESFDKDYALVPAMTWESNIKPEPPQSVTCDSISSIMKWSGAIDNSNGPYLTYNIYSSYEFPVDISRAENLVAIRRHETSSVVPLNGKFYAVTAMDRYGNESLAKQNYEIPTKSDVKRYKAKENVLPLFNCDGDKVYIGKTVANKSDLIQIETMMGVAVKISFVCNEISVRDLPDGFYLLRSKGRKKASHRLGYFKLERNK